MKLCLKITHKRIFACLICVLWSYKALVRYLQSIVMHIPIIGTSVYTVFPCVLFTILIVGAFPYILKKIRVSDLLFYFLIFLISIITILIDSRTTSKFSDYVVGFLTYVVPMYYIGIVTGDYLHKEDNLIFFLEKISAICIVVNVLYYSFIGFRFEAEWMSSQYIPYMLLPHVSLMTLSIFREYKLYKIIILLLGLSFMLFLGNRGSVVCYLVLLVVAILHKFQNVSANKRKIIIVIGIGLIMTIMLTNAYDTFTLFLLSKAEKLGMSTRVVLFLRRDFNVVSFDSNRLELQEQLFKAILDRPFGYGLTGDFSIIGGYSHNILLEWLVEFGIFFGSILIISHFLLVISSIRLAHNWNERSIIWLFFCDFLIMLLISATYLITPEFFFMVGFCVSVRRINKCEVLRRKLT